MVSVSLAIAERGLRPSFPASAPPPIVALPECCLTLKPAERASAREAELMLSDFTPPSETPAAREQLPVVGLHCVEAPSPKDQPAGGGGARESDSAANTGDDDEAMDTMLSSQRWVSRSSLVCENPSGPIRDNLFKGGALNFLNVDAEHYFRETLAGSRRWKLFASSLASVFAVSILVRAAPLTPPQAAPAPKPIS